MSFEGISQEPASIARIHNPDRETSTANEDDGRRHGLDRSDTRIPRVLQKNGRISNLGLGEEVHLWPTATPGPVQRLSRDGLIPGCEARLNPARLGAARMVFIEVALDRTTRDVMAVLKAAVQVRPETMGCHLVAGGFDYLIKARVANTQAYRELIGSGIRSLPGVRETRTHAVMEEVTSTTQQPL
jgi:Lrp/AsnC family transcriptional regulator, leucine-responsive regulatory protein